jgi:VWFA-related protein
MADSAKRIICLFMILAAAGLAAAQEIQHETRAIAVEVPVRVFKGNTFVDHLTISDFEVYEDGRTQTLDAVYLVKKASIEHQDGTQPVPPDTGRHFYLFFELTEYDPKVREALEYFVQEVLAPGDELVVVTPVKTYRMKSDILKEAHRSQVLEKILGLLRRDVQIGNAEYLDIMDDLKGLAMAMAGAIGMSNTDTQQQLRQTMGDPFGFTDSVIEVQRSVEEQLQSYADCLSRLESIRSVDQVRVNALADYLRNQSGQKEMFLFYQREFIPKIDDSVLNAIMSTYNQRPDITQAAMSVFEFFRRDETLDIETVKRLYADSGAAIHFLYLTRPAPKVRGLTMEERSEDIFSPFREMSLATGGYTGATANIQAAMKSAVSAAENYYLLYYTPKNYQPDGKFRALEVRVKGEGFRTSYRKGYIAD